MLYDVYTASQSPLFISVIGCLFLYFLALSNGSVGRLLFLFLAFFLYSTRCQASSFFLTWELVSSNIRTKKKPRGEKNWDYTYLLSFSYRC